jgi:hypothetical protein
VSLYENVRNHDAHIDWMKATIERLAERVAVLEDEVLAPTREDQRCDTDRLN